MASSRTFQIFIIICYQTLIQTKQFGSFNEFDSCTVIIVFTRSSSKFPIHGDKQIIRGATSMKSEILFQHMQFQARFQDHKKSSEFNGFYLSTGYTKYCELEKKLSPEYTS